MKFVTQYTILSFVFSISTSFKVELDRSKNFKKAIETSIKYPVLSPITVENDDKVTSIPMISIFDDTSFSPFTPALSAFMTFVSGKFQYIASSPAARRTTPTDQDGHTHVQCEDTHPRPLGESIKCMLPPTKRSIPRKTFAADENPSEYWFHNKIHSLGNTGFLGAFHAAIAPIAAKIIDMIAYDKVDVRSTVSKELADVVIQKTKARVLDLCCGVGMSTNVLKAAFHDAEAVIGIDTSPEMIETARGWTRHEIAFEYINAMLRQASSPSKQFITKVNNIDNDAFSSPWKKFSNTMFARGNAERTIFPDNTFDLVTIMYSFHEIPKFGRYRILREVRRILQRGGTLALVDISPEYQPSGTMLSGEPYVLEYQRNIQSQMKKARGFTNLRYKAVIPGHVSMWLLERKSS